MPPLKSADRIDANDPGCVKTLRGIIAPGILSSVVMRRAKKRKNLSSVRHYDQIRFRFRTTKTLNRHPSYPSTARRRTHSRFSYVLDLRRTSTPPLGSQ
jgi:hypothetical protein